MSPSPAVSEAAEVVVEGVGVVPVVVAAEVEAGRRRIRSRTFRWVCDGDRDQVFLDCIVLADHIVIESRDGYNLSDIYVHCPGTSSYFGTATSGLCQALDLALETLLDPQQDTRLPVVQLGHLIIVEDGLLEGLDVSLFTCVHDVLSEFGFAGRGEGDVLLGERLQ